MITNYAPVGNYGKCHDANWIVATDDYCSNQSGNNAGAVAGATFNQKTRACDCPSGSVLLEQRCRSLNLNKEGSGVDFVKQVIACYYYECARTNRTSDVYSVKDSCLYSDDSPTYIKVNGSFWYCGYNANATTKGWDYIHFALGLQPNCKYNSQTFNVDCSYK